MNWKTTLACAVLFAGAGGLYFAWSPEPPPEANRLVPQLFAGTRPDHINRLEIVQAGEAEIVIEQRPDPDLGTRWRLVKPIDRHANEALVTDMVSGILSLRKGPTKQESPAAVGLDAPSLTVGVTVGQNKTTIKFGRPSTIDPSVRYFMVDGDPALYAGASACAAPFAKKLLDLRNRALALFEPHRVVKMKLEKRYEHLVAVMGPDGKPVYEPGPDGRPRMKKVARTVTESSVFELLQKPDRKGWFLTRVDGDAPSDERVNDPDIYSFVQSVRGTLLCQQFIDKGDPKDYGLDAPDVAYSLWFRDAARPVVIRACHREAMREGPPSGTKVWAMVEGNDEIAMLPAEAWKLLDRKRNDFRSKQVFDFPVGQVQSLEIRTAAGHRLELVAHQPPDPAAATTWVVREPRMRTIPADDLYKLVDRLLAMEIHDRIPMQPDLALFGLEKGKEDLVFTVRVKRSADVVESRPYRFGHRGGEDAYVIRPGNDSEIGFVRAENFRALDLADLLARHREMFSCPNKDIVEIAVEFRQQGQFIPVYYIIERQGAGWRFKNTEMKDKEVDPDLAGMLAASISYLEAESLVSRRPEVAAEHRIVGITPPTRLSWKYLEGGKVRQMALNIGERVEAPRGAGDLYYAKFEPEAGQGADPFYQIVFLAKPQLVELMRKGVKKGPDQGTNPRQPTPKAHDDHDHK